jgi:hypothetical protein
LCPSEQEQSSSDAITSCIGNTPFSRLELMLYRSMLGKSPLVLALFANLTINGNLEAVPKPTRTG